MYFLSCLRLLCFLCVLPTLLQVLAPPLSNESLFSYVRLSQGLVHSASVSGSSSLHVDNYMGTYTFPKKKPAPVNLGKTLFLNLCNPFKAAPKPLYL